MSSLMHQLATEHAAPLRERSQRLAGLGLRVRVAWRRSRLDELLAEGMAPEESSELALRATQLIRPRQRQALAKSLTDVLRTVRSGRPPRSAAPPLAIRDVRACTSELCELVLILRGEGKVGVRGLALTSRLLSDGGGPLYVYRGNDELWQATRDAAAALEGRGAEYSI
jgi:hypothetical protein